MAWIALAMTEMKAGMARANDLFESCQASPIRGLSLCGSANVGHHFLELSKEVLLIEEPRQ